MAEDDTPQPPRKEPDEALMKALDSLRGLLDANRKAADEKPPATPQARGGALPDIPVLREVVDRHALARPAAPASPTPAGPAPEEPQAPPPARPALPPELFERLEGEIDAAVATAAAQLAEDIKRRLREAFEEAEPPPTGRAED